MDRLTITPSLSLDPAELTISFIRASGPGGQNVNKVSSAAQLRFNLDASPSLPEPLKARARRLALSPMPCTSRGSVSASRTSMRALSAVAGS